MDFNRTWTAFALDAEVEHHGFERIAKAHNRLRQEIETLRTENARLRAELARVTGDTMRRKGPKP